MEKYIINEKGEKVYLKPPPTPEPYTPELIRQGPSPVHLFATIILSVLATFWVLYLLHP